MLPMGQGLWYQEDMTIKKKEQGCHAFVNAIGKLSPYKVGILI